MCSKCHTTPAEAAGLSGTHDMTCAPVPELLESPPVASTKGPARPRVRFWRGGCPSMTPVPPTGSLTARSNDPFEKDAGLSDGDREQPTRLEAGMMKASPEVAAILRFTRRRDRRRARPAPRPDLPGLPPGGRGEVPPVR